MTSATAQSGWWRGFVIGGVTAWLVAAFLLATYARATAMIPVAEPMHSRFIAEANGIALKLFAIFASPAIIVLLVFGLWKGLGKR